MPVRPLPRYALVGLLVMALSEVAMLLEIEPFWSWHTPIAWSGYILFVDGFIWTRRYRSWLTTSRAEFAVLALLSIPLWLIFEGYNLAIRNWHYVNLPENVFLRHLGYAWSFATIWPAIFETAEAVAVLRAPGALPAPPHIPPPGQRRFTPVRIFCMVAGAGLLAWPLIQQSAYLAAPVWLGFIFLLDPLNARLGQESLLLDFERRRYDRLVNLAVAGLACGLIWEFWNYWARTRWIYTLPILSEPRLFEMPLAGYLGFPAFAIECFTMYVAARLLVWRGPSRSISL